jgi:hypothetical protein
MDEQLFAALVWNYKPKTFLHVKPLYCSRTHLCSFWPNSATN